MPELPEVETVVRSIADHVIGKTIQGVKLSSLRVTRGGLLETATALAGALVVGLRRHGKQIHFELDRGTLYVHLGMTGKLLWNASPGKYTRGIVQFDDGVLLFDDTRQFGRLEFFRELPAIVSRIGPDALGIGFEEFYSRMKTHRTRIKALLLNQTFIGGVGNIYADELLFASGVHPRAVAARISRVRAQKIHQNLIQVLQLAIQHRGSSISDYVDSAGERGSFQQMHQVYGRTGAPCNACGTPIRRIIVGQRSTHYCPRCQRV